MKLREHVARLAGGARYRVRPVRPSDEPGLSRFLETLNPEEIRLRFFRSVRFFQQHRLVGPLAEFDDRHFGLVASLPEDRSERFVATAMLVRDRAGTGAEFAVLVHHDHTRRGLGRYLLDCLLLHARESGVATVFGIALAENTAMLSLARGMGFRLVPDSDDRGCVHMEIPCGLVPPP